MHTRGSRQRSTALTQRHIFLPRGMARPAPDVPMRHALLVFLSFFIAPRPIR